MPDKDKFLDIPPEFNIDSLALPGTLTKNPLLPDLKELGNIRGEAWQEHTEELKQIAAKIYTGTPKEQTEASQRLAQIKTEVGPKESQFVDEFFSKTILEGTAHAVTGKMTEQELEQLNKTVTTSAILSGIKAGTSITQIITGAYKKAGLEPPKLPPDIHKNQALANQITKTMTLAEQGDPVIRQFFTSKLAEQNAIDNARSKSLGNVGQVAGNIQANALRRNKTLLDYAKEENQFKAGARGELANLLRTSIAEDQAIQANQVNKFGILEKRHNRELDAAQSQVNSGFNNLFGTLNEASGFIPFIGAGKRQRNQQQVAAGGPPPLDTGDLSPFPGDEQPALGDIDNLTPFEEQPDLNIRNFSNAELSLLPTYGTDKDIAEFQDIARREGFKIDEAETGLFGPMTQEALSAKTSDNPFRLPSMGLDRLNLMFQGL